MGKANGKRNSEGHYLGVDVGGTKVQASLVTQSGEIVARHRLATPRDGGPTQVLEAIEQAIRDLLSEAKLAPEDLTALGVAIPGVVDPDTAQIVVTPNMSLSGVAIGQWLEDRLDVPVAVGNDCNLGALGEKWLGAAQQADSVVAILIGTGIGGGFVQGGKLWRGAREAACEIGHIVMQIGGPKCGCGNHGCLEALASRSAIEREIRHGVAAGRTSAVLGLVGGDLSVIRSGALRRALAMKDELVEEVVRRAAEVIGCACLTVRHLIDPEVIVIGGGVVEACGDFMMPFVESVVQSDQLPGARDGGRVVRSALGDDAVVLGAVALARMHVGRSPFKKPTAGRAKLPQIARAVFGEITVGRKTFDRDIYISVSGKVKKRNRRLAKKLYGSAHTVGPEELEKVCRGRPEVLLVGSGHSGKLELTEEARQYLKHRSIRCEVLPTPEVVPAYNQSTHRKAALIHVTC